MRVIDILTRGNFEVVNVFQNGKPIDSMNKGMAILTIGDLEFTDFWIQNDGLGCLNLCIYLKEV